MNIELWNDVRGNLSHEPIEVTAQQLEEDAAADNSWTNQIWKNNQKISEACSHFNADSWQCNIESFLNLPNWLRELIISGDGETWWVNRSSEEIWDNEMSVGINNIENQNWVSAEIKTISNQTRYWFNFLDIPLYMCSPDLLMPLARSTWRFRDQIKDYNKFLLSSVESLLERGVPIKEILGTYEWLVVLDAKWDFITIW